MSIPFTIFNGKGSPVPTGGGMSAGAIAGIVMLCLVIVICFGALIVVRRRKRRRQGLRTGRKWTTGIPQATSMQNLFSHPAPGRNKRATGIPQTTGTPPHSGAKRDHWNARSHTYTHPHRSGSTGHCNLANVFVRVCLHAHMLTCVYAYMYMSGTLPIRLSNRIVL